MIAEANDLFQPVEDCVGTVWIRVDDERMEGVGAEVDHAQAGRMRGVFGGKLPVRDDAGRARLSQHGSCHYLAERMSGIAELPRVFRTACFVRLVSHGLFRVAGCVWPLSRDALAQV